MTAPQTPDSAPTATTQKGASVSAEPAGSTRTSAPADPVPTAPADPVSTRSGPVADDGKVRRPGPPRPASSRAASPRAGSDRAGSDRAGSDRVGSDRPGAAKVSPGRTRKARLALKRIDPWSVFLFTLIASIFIGIALVVAVGVLFAILSSLGVVKSVNDLVSEVTGDTALVLSMGRLLSFAAVLAAVNVVLLTLLATLGSLLYNACAAFTGGIELTLGERDG